MSREFLLASLIIVASPGTGAIYTIASWLRRSFAAASVALGAKLALTGR